MTARCAKCAVVLVRNKNDAQIDSRDVADFALPGQLMCDDCFHEHPQVREWLEEEGDYERRPRRIQDGGRIQPPERGVVTTPQGEVRTDGLVAVPQRRWRGWRDKQPQRNPVTVKRLREPGAR